jgi:IclR family acetate operon transcriptional repressor
MHETDDANTLQTTEVSLELFDHIRERGGATLRQLTAATGLSKSSVYVHLSTLQTRDLVTKEGEQYHVGLRILEYAEKARRRKPEYDLARETVDDLLERLGEECGFAVEENGRTVLFYNATNTRQPTFYTGKTGPMHATAAGKAMLSAYSKDVVDQIIDSHGLSGETEKTITDRDELMDELETIRERGYAVIDEEFVEGMHSISVPVRYPNGQVFGALHVSAPAYRQDDQGLWQLGVDELRLAASNLEDKLESQKTTLLS